MKLILYAIISFLFIFAALNPAAANYIFDNDIQIVQSDETGITLVYNAPKAELVTPDGYSDKYKAPEIARTARIAKSGAPLLPVKLIPIGVPFNAQPSITVISQSYSPLAEVEVPNYISERSEKAFSEKLAAQTIKKDWPLKTAYIEDETVIRGLRVLKLALAAAKLESGVLYQANEITVRIDFNSEVSAKTYAIRPNGAVFDRVMTKVVANFETAKNWRVDWPPIPYKTATTQSVFDSSQVWVRLVTTTAGIYKITRFALSYAGIDVASIDPRELRIFYGGGAELPTDNDLPRPPLFEIPISVSGADDGSFDNADELLFYAEAVDRAEYDTTSQRYEFHRNHYTAKNAYWLTSGGDFGEAPKRWAEINGAPEEQFYIAKTSFTDLNHIEQELDFYVFDPIHGEPSDYYNWFAGNQKTFSYSAQLSDFINGSEADIVVKSKRQFDLLKINNQQVSSVSHSGEFTEYISQDFHSGTAFNTLYLEDSDPIFLDYIDIRYERLLNVNSDQLAFYSPAAIGTIQYELSGVPADYMLLDISEPANVARITEGELTGGVLKFQNLNTGHRKFYVVSPAGYKTVNSYEIYEPDDLHSTSNGADYIIITPELFYDQSLQLAAHRQSLDPDLRVRVVKLQDIYNQFSWGLDDPLAIRDFLKYAFENWEGAPPAYALLVGDGHFDYRNNWNNNAPNYIPPFHSTKSSTGRVPFGADESYTYFGEFGNLDYDDSGSLDMMIGRLPVNSTDDMDVILNKIFNYDSHPNLGKWRNTVVVVADDNLSGEYDNESIHTNQGEDLANNHVPNKMEVKKIFLVNFPLRTGNSKPDAREALIKAFNDGGLIVDWIGHGNKGLWAHEQLFRRIEDLPRLTNIDKLPLVFTASCSIGYFDHPMEQGMAEDLVRLPVGGSIVSIGATRQVYSGANIGLNQDFFDQLLYEDSTSFAQALYVAKFLREVSGPSDNDRKFMYFGDPAIIAGMPVLEAQFTYGPDSLRGLSVDSVAGYVTDDSGHVQSDFNGTIWVLVKDASISVRRYETGYDGNPNGLYNDLILPGPTIFNGPAEVVNGHFSTSFFIPKDITYGGSGARIFAYFENGVIDGSGVIDSLPMAGAASSEADTIGPDIEVLYNDRTLDDNSLEALPSNAAIQVRLFDPHGINITGTMGHAIMVEVNNGETYSLDITDNFTFDLGQWQRGSVYFQLPELPEGEHLLTIKSWDNYNNSALFSTHIQTYASEEFYVSDVMNYPNPVVEVDSTVFQYMLSNDAERVTLKIFTLAGRKIRTFDLHSAEYTSSGFHYLPYNLRDSDGDRIASGIYIYLLEATGTGFDGQRRKSDFQSKLAIIR